MLLPNKKKPIPALCLDTYVIRDKNCIGYCCDNPLNLEKKLQIASEAGFKAVELWHKDVFGYIQQRGVTSLVDLLSQLDLTVASYKVVEGWFEDSNTTEVIETAAKIGALACVIKVIGDNNPNPRSDINWFVSRYQELLKRAADINIKPALEFMALSKSMNSITHVYDILEQVDHPLASLVLDTWHLWRNDDVEFTAFEQSLSRLQTNWIAVVHFTDASKSVPRQNQKDGDRKLPGYGCLNLNKFCALLGNFSGPYSLNVYDRSLWNENPLQVATKGKYLMKQCIESRWAKNLGDSETWKTKQEMRCDALWFKQYYTHLDPRIFQSNRTTQMEAILKPDLQGVVLDFKCGFSPLASYMSYGFDAYRGCIDYLKDKYPAAQWTCCSDDDFARNFSDKIDVLFHIGLGDSNTEISNHFQIREKCKPSKVIIECAANEDGTVNESKSGNTSRWNHLKDNLKNIRQYVLHTDMPERSHRLLLVGEL